jgi:large subunit ribosomal protein L29
MKLKDIKNLTVTELRSREALLRKELFSLRIQMRVGKVENPLRLRTARRELARVLTLIAQSSNQ